MNPRSFFRPVAWRAGFSALGVLLVVCCSGLARASSLADVVGEVTTVIGVGLLKSGSGIEAPVQRGMAIREGDRIETAEGGHVHIRFIDGGLISVRPSSRLHVESYRNAGPWGQAALKFNLQEGVVRSVTGRWGESNRDRFRLNTPVAAIGVKGTDFVVRVNGGNTYASVISGAIQMAPLDGACAVALGPCQGEHAVALDAGMRGKMLELLHQNGISAPRLVPAIDLLARGGPLLPAGETAAAEVLPVPATNEEKKHPEEKKPTSNTASSENTVVAKEKLVAAPVAVPVSRPMVWMHNARGWNVDANSISERYDRALADGREPVVGNFFITLYRDESVQKKFQPFAHQASFSLSRASASYTQPVATGRPAEDVQISSAALNVDFARSTFSTQMQLSSPSLGNDGFSAGGTVGADGVFTQVQPSQNLAGAFSKDGRQAGYLFEKTTAGGKISGLTLWGQ